MPPRHLSPPEVSSTHDTRNTLAHMSISNETTNTTNDEIEVTATPDTSDHHMATSDAGTTFPLH